MPSSSTDVSGHMMQETSTSDSTHDIAEYAAIQYDTGNKTEPAITNNTTSIVMASSPRQSRDDVDNDLDDDHQIQSNDLNHSSSGKHNSHNRSSDDSRQDDHDDHEDEYNLRSSDDDMEQFDDHQVNNNNNKEDELPEGGAAGYDSSRNFSRISNASRLTSFELEPRADVNITDDSDFKCPKCELEFSNEEVRNRHLVFCAGLDIKLPAERELFPSEGNGSNNNLNSPHGTDFPLQDETNLSQVQQLIRGLTRLPQDEHQGHNPVLDALKMKLLSSADIHIEPKCEDFQNMSSLQRAYYTLQHQQMLQVQLIQKIQAQLSLCNKEKIPGSENAAMPHLIQQKNRSPIHEKEERKSPSPKKNKSSHNILNDLMERFKPNSESKPTKSKKSQANLDPRDQPLSPSPMSIPVHGSQNSVLRHADPPTNAETNSLEKLQQTANHVLTKASQGIFTHHLIEDRNTPEGRDSSNKHKCRYCGKVFGSDSGLQIHLRSHTGERPFKCNICGNRFTTRGNLKVHFQRHQSRFPHIKMNHNPVPEHLDKLYPPLLAQLGELEDTPPAPTGPPNPFSPPITMPQLSPYNLSSPPTLSLQQPLAASLIYRRVLEKNDHDAPPHNFQDLHSSRMTDILRRSSSPGEEMSTKDENHCSSSEKHTDDIDMSDSLSEGRKSFMDKLYSENSMDNANSEGGCDDGNLAPKCEMNDLMDDEISDDSSGSPNSNLGDFQNNRELLDLLQRRQLELPPANVFPGMRLPFNFPFLPGLCNVGSRPPGSKPGPNVNIPGGLDVTKDPNLYANLLPRPGSTDNSWEALIEVQKTSETMKLEQLVNNIENKLTDPNQCIICHRVLSCKSALQMHYRIHTGERPYKCKICSRTFTTKGNLKTHMSVHRARPPIRMLHQCPVCHKRYNNGMILQQHIRQHTGEPTDISNEQMAAAEVKELLPNSMHPMLMPRFPPFAHHIPGLLPLMHPLRPQLFHEHISRDFDSRNDSQDDERDQRPRSSSHRSIAEDGSDNQSISEDGQNNKHSPTHSTSPGPIDFSYSPRNREKNSEERTVKSKGLSNHLDDKSPSRGVSPSRRDESLLTAPLDLALRPPPPSLFSPFGLFPPPLTSTALSLASQPLPLSAKSRFMPPMINIPGQGNTTCKICFKTLSCASALEIHYRSHTKDRPFTCTVCDRKFTTRGNMKQHMVTHKGHEDNSATVAPSTEKHAKSKSSRSHSPKTSISLPPVSNPLLPSYIQAGMTSSGSSGSVLHGIPLSPALFSYPQFSHPLAALPGSIAALLGQTSMHEASVRGEEAKVDLMNLKREREGELPLPVSKRTPGPPDVDIEEKMSTTPPPSPGGRKESTAPSPHATLPSTSPHSISQLLQHQHHLQLQQQQQLGVTPASSPPHGATAAGGSDHPACHPASSSPHTQPLLVS